MFKVDFPEIDSITEKTRKIREVKAEQQRKKRYGIVRVTHAGFGGNATSATWLHGPSQRGSAEWLAKPRFLFY
jgi:hypothetical protein